MLEKKNEAEENKTDETFIVKLKASLLYAIAFPIF